MATSDISSPLRMLLSDTVPIDHREILLREICREGGEETTEIIRGLLQEGSAKSSKSCDRKAEELQERIDDLNRGPLRPAAFLSQDARARGIVCLEDGTTAIVSFADDQLPEQLKLGDPVLLDKGGNAIVSTGVNLFGAGQEALWVRTMEDDRVEVELRDERFLFHMAARLRERHERGEVEPGCMVIVSPRQKIAFDAVPRDEGLSNFTFLDSSPVPDVVVERDIANPPAFLRTLGEHVRMGLTDPDTLRRYGLSLSTTGLLVGPSGVGKSLCIEGLIRKILEIVSRVIGVPVADLPPRVMRMRPDNLLSEYLGRSDKQIARFFQEAIELYDRPVCGADGKPHHIPVIAVGEECDAFSRARGLDHETVMDRIQTGFLRGLDPARPEYKTRLIIFLFTSNVPDLIDPAFLRRAGGFIWHFPRLTNRKAFQAVLDKHLNRRPFSSSNGTEQEVIRRQVSQAITSWLFSPNSEEQELVELSCAGSETLRKSRRDFMTGALVERAVHQAAQRACQLEVDGCESPGLTLDGLARAFDDQIHGIVDQLSAGNAANYVDLPAGTRVTNVRRLTRSSHLPFELMRIP